MDQEIPIGGLVRFSLRYDLGRCPIDRGLSAGWIGLQILASAHFLTSYGPMLSAFIVTTIVGGAAGVRELFGRMTRWRVGLRWILVAVASPIALYLVAGLVMRILQGSWLDWSRFGDAVEIAGLGGVFGWAYHTLTFGFG